VRADGSPTVIWIISALGDVGVIVALVFDILYLGCWEGKELGSVLFARFPLKKR